ncbi:GNAT family N-acetyltransferase [Streptomyces sp. UH6]|uniref:GNAT family N-acetyltransferase n=1 Tax=Streptomyces sp. UH6 TaxID=2748379 RepID=UPI00280C2581|nr:GNAT family N-acetyltransferase [Streptomyces sp. UH6]
MNPALLTVRPLTGRDELDLFLGLSYALDAELAADLDEGRRRPDRMWVAHDGDRLLARLAWWNRLGADRPLLLDVLDVDDTLPAADRLDVGEHLLRTAMSTVLDPAAPVPEYTRFVPPGWRDVPAVRRAVEDRMAIAERTGARLFVERLRLDRSPGLPVPPPTGRLVFRTPRDERELTGLMARVLEGTLDAHSLHDLTTMSAQEAAEAQYADELARYRSPRDWWRVAELPDGGPVGFVVPAHNGYNPVIAYLAVVPEHRGKGYVDEILAEGTRVLTAQDVPRIRASTDLGNVPMAAAFARAGYVDFEREINMTWS